MSQNKKIKCDFKHTDKNKKLLKIPRRHMKAIYDNIESLLL
jgi:hypothetical protein